MPCRGLVIAVVFASIVSGTIALCSCDATADEVATGLDLTGQVAVVIGGDSELGFPVVVALARQGAEVVIASHNISKCEAAARRAAALTKGRVQGMAVDLASFASVSQFVTSFLSASKGRLNILVNNAGIAGNPAHNSSDGFQLLFQINYLAPFLLTELLLPALRNSGSPDRPAKVVNVASSEHKIACEAAGWLEGCLSDWKYLPPPSVPDKNVTIHYADGGTEVRPVELYGFTKFLLMEHAVELGRREALGAYNVQAFSLTPGWVNTSLTRNIKMNSTVARRKCAAQSPCACPFTPDEGAAIVAFAALRANQSGAYYSRLRDCQTDSIVSHGFNASMGPELYERSLQWARLGLRSSLSFSVV